MRVFTSAHEARQFSRQQRKEGRSLAFVPTMGFLHEGHLELVRAAVHAADVVIASIYVNPTQFSEDEDFGEYPRDAEGDRAKLEAAGCSAVFEPASLYHAGGDHHTADDNCHVVGPAQRRHGAHETFVQVESLQQPMCGSSRPHFFRGVATIVTKLFNIVEPDVAVFGKKDYQQWRVICRMVRDLDFCIDVIGVPISRDSDGLALSSRNARLTPEARTAALAIPQALQRAREAARSDKRPSPDELATSITSALEASGGNVDYVQVVDAHNLTPVHKLGLQETVIAVAAKYPAKSGGLVRLIDNVEC